ncbi:acyl carrier protein [Streptomyces griseosporeus]|uniref:acyl carrier protein n=1 Tax=Streptomyces griseosporeus TaxID=1910 RepID=UPI0036F4C132
MPQFTVDDLKDLLVKAAGESADAPALTAADVELSFADLGYDSLAMLEVAGLVQHHFRVTLDDDVVTTADTPRKFLDLVNGLITAGAA